MSSNPFADPCRGKISHATLAAAQGHKLGLLQRDKRGVFSIYACVECGGYHVGNTSRTKLRPYQKKWRATK